MLKKEGTIRAIVDSFNVHWNTSRLWKHTNKLVEYDSNLMDVKSQKVNYRKKNGD